MMNPGQLQSPRGVRFPLSETGCECGSSELEYIIFRRGGRDPQGRGRKHHRAARRPSTPRRLTAVGGITAMRSPRTITEMRMACRSDGVRAPAVSCVKFRALSPDYRVEREVYELLSSAGTDPHGGDAARWSIGGGGASSDDPEAFTGVHAAAGAVRLTRAFDEAQAVRAVEGDSGTNRSTLRRPRAEWLVLRRQP